MSDWKQLGEVATDAYRRLEAEHLEWLTDEEKADFYGELKGYAAEKGYSDGWAAHYYRERFNGWPRGAIQKAQKRPCGDEVRMWIKASMHEWWKRDKAPRMPAGSR